MAGENDEETHLTGTEARAGVMVGAMRYVLGISMALVIVIFLIILWWPFG